MLKQREYKPKTDKKGHKKQNLHIVYFFDFFKKLHNIL